MAIRLENITKCYGSQKALDGVSFEISSGQIVGLLGPNGAGKTTLMKILTAYILPDQGSAFVEGIKVGESAMELRKKVGYLPEHNPLYGDMYVKEFLEFSAGFYVSSEKARKRAEELIEIVGITKEYKKKIKALSKGYKQRVGLAQALIHDPSVLILDEPTSGLDPNQLEEVRRLIKDLGREKTVLLSTHIMQEVEALCERVLILRQGKLLADDQILNMQNGRDSGVCLCVEVDKALSPDLFSAIEGVHKVERIAENTFKLYLLTKGRADVRKDIAAFAVKEGFLILSMEQEKLNLEKVFQRLTKE